MLVGTPLNIIGVGRTKLHLTGIRTPLDASMLVVEELAVEAILGLDFSERHKFAIGCEHRTITQFQFPKQGKLLTYTDWVGVDTEACFACTK